jgi:PadR family transcriptional regulator, regulatory protein PadR
MLAIHEMTSSLGESKSSAEGAAAELTSLAAPIDTSHRQTMGVTNQPPDLLPGTLDLLILRTLQRGPMHGYGIAEHLRAASQHVLVVGESSLYPALQRLLLNGWTKAEWGVSDNNRRARYYTLTPAGRRRLAEERKGFDQLVGAILRVLEA